MNFGFDLKTVVVGALLAYTFWLLFSLPAQIKNQRRKLIVFRQSLATQVSKTIIGSLEAKPHAGLKEIFKSETLEYDKKAISAKIWRIIFTNDENQFWLHAFYSDDRPPLVKLINELRARRTLFLHPREYEIAFGACPHRDQLKLILEKSMSSKLERFDPNLHAGEMLVTEPIGQEFGARTI